MGKDLYVSLNLPSLIIGTVGGGVSLPTQRECLEIMGCYGARESKEICRDRCRLLYSPVKFPWLLPWWPVILLQLMKSTGETALIPNCREINSLLPVTTISFVNTTGSSTLLQIPD
jgi:hypothetical protein